MTAHFHDTILLDVNGDYDLPAIQANALQRLTSDYADREPNDLYLANAHMDAWRSARLQKVYSSMPDETFNRAIADKQGELTSLEQNTAARQDDLDRELYFLQTVPRESPARP